MKTYKKLSIKEWAESDRPREKLLQRGRKSLSDAELITILIGSGSAEQSALELSRSILDSCGHDLNKLARLEVADLITFKGIGPAKAISIAAALELGSRRASFSSVDRVVITNSHDAYQYIRQDLEDLDHEQFWVVLLNQRAKVISKHLVSTGGVSATVIDSRLVFKPAIQWSASQLILAHNHPSGEVNPSQQDIQVTHKLQKAAMALDLRIVDHIIVGDDQYYSLGDEGKFVS